MKEFYVVHKIVFKASSLFKFHAFCWLMEFGCRYTGYQWAMAERVTKSYYYISEFLVDIKIQ